MLFEKGVFQQSNELDPTIFFRGLHPRTHKLHSLHFLIAPRCLETTFGSFHEDFVVLYVLKSFIDLSPKTKNIMLWQSLPPLRSSAAFVEAFGKMIKYCELLRKIQGLVNQNGILLINSTNTLHRSCIFTAMGIRKFSLGLGVGMTKCP